MNYLQNAYISKVYSVSNQTVVNWKNKAKELNIELVEVNGRQFIADTESNRAVLDTLVFDRKIKDTSRRYKIVQPLPEFYESFKDIEIIDFTRELKTHRQSNIKYSYKNIGAKFWDQFYQKSAEIPEASEQLLNNFLSFCTNYLPKNKDINLIDIGYGNALPAFPLIERLNIKHYIGIDISDDMKSIAKENLGKKFKKIKTDFFYADIEKTDIAENTYRLREKNTTSIFLHIGNTLSNHDDRDAVYKNIQRAIAPGDLALITFSIENDINYGALQYANTEEANKQDTSPLRLFGIDTDKCEIQLRYDSKLNAKQKLAIIDKNYKVNYQAFGEKLIFEFHKGQAIDVWRHYLLTEEQFIKEVKNCGLKLRSLQLDKEGNNALAVLSL